MSENRVGVVLATLGRPDVVGRHVARLQRQSLPPARVVISASSPDDVPADLPEGISVVFGPKGTCAQRNRGLNEIAQDCDVVAFFDDDYVAVSYTLEGIADLFARYPDVIGANGMLLADGINSFGIDFESAIEMLAPYEGKPRPTPTIVRELIGLYGCNMVYRTSAIRDMRFDESLPLYGWLEDVDFAARARSKGRLVLSDAFVGVHQGVKGGRNSGRKFGYSQIANPLYLRRKGTLPATRAVWIMIRNLLANHGRAFWPEAWIDRQGRVTGNWLAIRDLVKGELDPNRIITL